MNNNITQHISDYLDFLHLVRRLSAHTVAAYQHDLAVLSEAVGEAKITAVDSFFIRQLISQQPHLKATSVARLLSSWRTFFDYLIKNNVVKINPVLAVKSPKQTARLPKSLSPDEVSFMLEATTKKNWVAVRDNAILELLYSSAIRLSELTQLDLVDLNLKNRVLTVQKGKGGVGRVVPIGNAAAEAMADWLAVRRKLKLSPDLTTLFISQHKKRLSARTIQKTVEKYGRQANLSKAVSPHVFRHSCASHFLQSSGDLRATQELLGHKNINTTQIYTRLDFQHLAKVYDQTHPRTRRTPKS